MTLYQIIKVGLISLILIFLILLVVSSFFFFMKKKKLNRLNRKKKIKSKRKKKYYRRKKIILEKSIKKQQHFMISLITLDLLMIVGLYAFIYYENSNIASTDSDSIVRGYFLVDDFKKEIERASDSSNDEEASKQNIKYLALSMATYSNKTANSLNTKEGQLLINKYYKQIGQLGMNATRDINSFYGNKNDILSSYKSELLRVKENENKAFEYYKINANSLNNNVKK